MGKRVKKALRAADAAAAGGDPAAVAAQVALHNSFNYAQQFKPKKGLGARIKNSILNPKVAIKDVGDTARAGLKGNTADKRANLRANFQKTVHPLQATAQNITYAEKLKRSESPEEVRAGVALRARADERSMLSGVRGATVGVAFATGGAVKGAMTAAKVAQGAPKSNVMPADPSNWHPGDAYPDPSRVADTQEQMYRRRPVGAPARAAAGNGGVGGLLTSTVNLLWQILVPKRG